MIEKIEDLTLVYAFAYDYINEWWPSFIYQPMGGKVAAANYRTAGFTSRKKEKSMQYGKGAAPSAAGIAVLPFTGSNDTLFIVAASLIGLGLAVFAASLIVARKNRPVSAS